MKRIILPIAIFLLQFSVLYGQTDKVKGSIWTVDTADLTILNIFPDSFPNVSVVFKAETRKGEPIWNLTKDKIIVKENSQICKAIFLEQISKYKPINIGIVIDHSSSMLNDESLMFDKDSLPLFSYDAYGNILFPKGYKAPIDNAKESVKRFITSFNTKKDYISVVGFSNFVDRKLSLTQNINKINSIVDLMVADYNTAFYDAMITSIEEIKKADGVKIIIALTDGQDNRSKSKWTDVVNEANREHIPIYIIGLGDVIKDTLKLIAKSTKGQFYYSQNSNLLQTIYALISKQVQAFYNLVYRSSNLSSADSTKQIELSFDIDSIYLISNPETITFTPEVNIFISKKEKQKEYFIYGGVALAVLITTGTLLFYFRRKKTINNKNQPIIKKLFPNPTTGIINLDFENLVGQLQIISLNGQIVKDIEINGSKTQFDLSEIPNGNYIAIIKTIGQQSNAIKFVIQK